MSTAQAHQDHPFLILHQVLLFLTALCRDKAAAQATWMVQMPQTIRYL
jgi:hypothetical protein